MPNKSIIVHDLGLLTHRFTSISPRGIFIMYFRYGLESGFITESTTQRRRGANLWSAASWLSETWPTKRTQSFSQEDIIICRKACTELGNIIIVVTQTETGCLDLWEGSNKLVKCFSAYLSMPAHVLAYIFGTCTTCYSGP